LAQLVVNDPVNYRLARLIRHDGADTVHVQKRPR
jgi:hypothetical protein